VLDGIRKGDKCYVDKDGKTIQSMIYEIVQQVPPSLLEKAMANVDEEWLKKVLRKRKK